MSFLRPGDIDVSLSPGEMACIPDWVMRGYPIENYPNLRDIFIEVVWPASGHMQEFTAVSSGVSTRARWSSREKLQEALEENENKFLDYVAQVMPVNHKRIRWTRPIVTLADSNSSVSFTFQHVGLAAYTDTVAAHMSSKRPFFVEDKDAQKEINIDAVIANVAKSWGPVNILKLLIRDFL